MYTYSARYYDALYAFKDYPTEASKVAALIERHKRSAGNRLLDVACGTGKHIECWHGQFEMTGLDIEPNQLGIARQRNPSVAFVQGDMLDFDLGAQFDAVVCLFSAIAYARTVEGLHAAIACMARHVAPSGLLIIEAFIRPEVFQDGHLSSLVVDEPDLKIVRMSRGVRDAHVAVFDMHHMVGTPQGIETFVERHELAMFTDEEYIDALRISGLELVEHDPEGLMGRSLFIARRPAAA